MYSIIKIVLLIVMLFSEYLIAQYFSFTDEEGARFRNFKKIRVVIEDTTNNRFEDRFNEILTAFNYEPVDRNSKDYDATMIVYVKPDMLRSWYYSRDIPYQAEITSACNIRILIQLCFDGKLFYAKSESNFTTPDTTRHFNSTVQVLFYDKYDPSIKEKTYNVNTRFIKSSSYPKQWISLPLYSYSELIRDGFNVKLFSEIIGHFASIHDPHLIFNLLKSRDSILVNAAIDRIEKKEKYVSIKCDALTKYLSDPNISVKTIAAKTLINKYCPYSIEKIIALLNEKDIQLQRNIISVLGKSRNPLIVKPLMEFVKSKDALIIQNLSTALSNFPSYALEELKKIKYGKDKNLENNILLVKEKITESLNFIGKVKGYKFIKKYDKDHNEKYRALARLSFISESEAINILLNSYHFADEMVMGALKMHGEYSVDHLVQKINKSYVNEKSRYIELLGNIKCKKSFDALSKLLNEEPNIKTIITAIGKQGSSDAIQLFEELLKVKGKDVLFSIISALGDINDPLSYQFIIRELRKYFTNPELLSNQEKYSAPPFGISLSKNTHINTDTLINMLNDNNEWIKKEMKYAVNKHIDISITELVVDLVRKKKIPPNSLYESLIVKFMGNEAIKYISVSKTPDGRYYNPLGAALVKDTAAVLQILQLNNGEINFEKRMALRNYGKYATQYIIKRKSFIDYLGILCDPDAIPFLFELCESGNSDVRNRAFQAYSELTGLSDPLNVMRKWYDNYSSYFR